MKSEQNIGFHEAGITGIHRDSDGTLVLLLEGVHVGDQLRNVSVRINGVRQITRDGLPADDFAMEYGDGEILTLDTDPDSIRLIVEWNDFANHRHVTSAYHIVSDSVLVEVC
jgi:hypothetical protein